MVIVRLSGGLGNQLFQYAIAKTIAQKSGTEIGLNVSDFTRSHARVFQLDNFLINAKINNSSPGLFRKFLNTFTPYHKKAYIKERHSGFDPEILLVTPPVFLEGYWQNEKYFKEIRPSLLKEIQLRAPMNPAALHIAEAITSTPTSVSVHIRRGDYMAPGNKEHYDVCTPDYYARAMRAISARIVSPHFFVFSDDIEWVKKNILFSHTSPATFVSEPGIADYEELMLMSMCRHNIIANSTFSWWGAWLNAHADKIIIAPEKWLYSDRYDTRDIVPATWWKM